jgi:aspartyl-tRNA(Asn)/glutamyl-tRNA(Gln) amidotransferase subunit A
MELYHHTIRELHRKLCDGQVSSRQITEAVLARIDELEPTLHSYIRVMREEALAQADQIDEQLRKGDIEPTYLTGIPLAVKDVMCIQGVVTTCAQKCLNILFPLRCHGSFRS